MKVFMSWSGERSKAVASALSGWLADVFRDVEPWMSAHNIDAGQRWGHELGEQLGSSNFGILCLTPENLESPWLLFEAGALSKFIGQARVVPYLFQLSTTDVPFPLAQFQGVQATNAGTLDLVKSINTSLERPIPDDRLERFFEKWWPDLEKGLELVPTEKEGVTPTHRSERALLEEILQTVRNMSRVATQTPPAPTVQTPPPASSEPNIDYWRGTAVWSLTSNDMESLSVEDLKEYVAHATAASAVAFPDGKEAAIDRKIALAEQEINKRANK